VVIGNVNKTFCKDQDRDQRRVR